MENDRFAKRIYLGECGGSRSVEEMDRYCEGLFKDKRFGCQARKGNGVG